MKRVLLAVLAVLVVGLIVIVAAYGRDSADRITQAVSGIEAAKIAGVVFNCPP